MKFCYDVNVKKYDGRGALSRFDTTFAKNTAHEGHEDTKICRVTWQFDVNIGSLILIEILIIAQHETQP